MIGRIIASVREAQRTPIGPGTAILGGVCMVLGASIVQRYVHQQQTAVSRAWQELQLIQAEEALIQRAARETHPGTEDVDPLHNNGHRETDDLSDLLAERIAAEPTSGAL